MPVGGQIIPISIVDVLLGLYNTRAEYNTLCTLISNMLFKAKPTEKSKLDLLSFHSY